MNVRSRVIGTVCCWLVAVVIAIPVLTVLSSVARDSEGVWPHLVDTVLPTYIRDTVWLTLGVGLCTSVLGITTAWLVTMHSFPGCQFLRWALILPMAIPTYLSAYALTDLFQFSGPVQSQLRTMTGWTRQDYWFPEIRSLSGAIVILTLGLYPYVYLASRAGFATQSAAVIEAGRVLGAGPLRCFFQIALPLARPAILAGLALVLMETVAEFGAVDYCAVDTFSTGIYRTWVTRGSLTGASQLSACLLTVAVILLLMETSSRRALRFHHATQRTQRSVPTPLSGVRKLFACLFCSLPLVFGFLLPFCRFVALTVQNGDQRAQELFGELLFNSVLLAGIASALTVTTGLFMVSVRRLTPSAWLSPAVAFAGMGYAIPGGVIAIGILSPVWWCEDQLLQVLENQFGYFPGLFISGSLLTLILGYLVRFLAVPLQVLTAGLLRIRTSIDDASRTLGCSGLQLLFRIHLPLLRHSLAAAALLVFVDVLKELPATLILRPFDFDTLAVRVYQLAADERLAEASTGALAIIVVGLLPVILLTNIIDQTPQSVTTERNAKAP